MTQRERILQFANVRRDVDYIFACFGGQVRKSVIRGVLASLPEQREVAISDPPRIRPIEPKPAKRAPDRFECSLPESVRAAIKQAAHNRSTKPADLVARVLTTVFTENLLDAVLDDGAAA